MKKYVLLLITLAILACTIWIVTIFGSDDLLSFKKCKVKDTSYKWCSKYV